MDRLTAWIPAMTTGTAILHLGYAAVSDGHIWADMAREGFVRTVAGQTELDAALRHGALWFLVTGVGLLAVGTAARQLLNSTGVLPRQVGVHLLLLGVPVAIVEPLSGGPLVVALGVLALLCARRSTETRRRPGHRDRDGLRAEPSPAR